MTLKTIKKKKNDSTSPVQFHMKILYFFEIHVYLLGYLTWVVKNFGTNLSPLQCLKIKFYVHHVPLYVKITMTYFFVPVTPPSGWAWLQR